MVFLSACATSISMSAEAILMVIRAAPEPGAVAWRGHYRGPSNLFSIYFEDWPIILARFFTVAVLYAPNGIVGWLVRAHRRCKKVWQRDRSPRCRDRRDTPAVTAARTRGPTKSSPREVWRRS
jgi:hypothetical protein